VSFKVSVSSSTSASGVKPIRKDLIVLPAGAVYLQVAQEVQYILRLGCTQHIERANHLVGFRAAACMRLDGCQQVVGTPVTQEEYALPDAP
jgi:hypothetical protein